ncbi:cell division control protein 2 homolog, partial [Camellia sinensis]|uniref:cell division control protein 2 homolog n=1 Tax=Camellia sinensis TaxID=4442 RepID=UPI001036F317
MQHRNILRLLDVVNKERSVHLVTEHVELDLRKFMDTSPEIVKTPRDFLHEILSGLDYCDSHNILHRGLNPGSLMLDHRSQSTVKIAGFRSAKTFGVPTDAYTKGVKWDLASLQFAIGLEGAVGL